MGNIGWVNSKNIYFEREQNSYKTTIASIIIKSLLTGTQRTLVSVTNPETLSHSIIDPTGTKIAWVTHTLRARGSIGLSIVDMRVTAVGTAHTVDSVQDIAYPGCLQWYGNSMVYSAGSTTQHELFLVDAKNIRHQLTFDLEPNGIGCGDISVSGNGYVAWIFIDGHQRVMIKIGRLIGGKLENIRVAVKLQDPLDGISSGKTQFIRWRSRDGLQFDGLLTLPTNYVHSRRYPLVVIIHGGPSGDVEVLSAAAAEWPGSMYFVEFLAERGYAVFLPDYRSSGMLGAVPLRDMRAKHDVFASPANDIIDGIRHLEAMGIADKRKLYLLGHSWGSYQANWIIAHTNMFRAAVSYEGGDVFFDWAAHQDGGLTQSTDYFLQGGTPLNDLKDFEANSAVFGAKNIRTPTLFINAGAEGDAVDSPSQPWLFAALRSQHVESEYIFYPNETHVISNPENQIDLLNRILSWLQSH